VSRKADHDRVNVILDRVNQVALLQVAIRYDPTAFDGHAPTRPWTRTRCEDIVTRWREQAWADAQRLADARTPAQKQAVAISIETAASANALALATATPTPRRTSPPARPTPGTPTAPPAGRPDRGTAAERTDRRAGSARPGDRRRVPRGAARPAAGCAHGDLWWVMFDESPIACSIVDIASGTLIVNRAYRELLGVSEDDEVTMEAVRSRTHPEELEELNVRFGAMDRGEVDRVELDRRYVRDDGSVIWGHLVTTLVRDERGEPVAVVGQMEDITERVEGQRCLATREATIRAQAALLNEQNRQLAERAERLAAARDEASRRRGCTPPASRRASSTRPSAARWSTVTASSSGPTWRCAGCWTGGPPS
jgi:PAS domain S-box-containing protein